jgi:2,5-diketo-D-gluconate reductase A
VHRALDGAVFYGESMGNNPNIDLNDGHSIPQLGYGLWQVPDDVTESVTREALKVGYRSIDSAAIYGNEAGLGKTIQGGDVPREKLFITTKLWNEDQGFDNTLKAFEKSLGLLGTDYLDLYLIHWPSPHRGLYVDSWKALIRLKDEGRVKSIGVSNFTPQNLEEIIGETGVIPAVNQIELHPRFQQRELRELHLQHGITTEAWSPLGQGKSISDPVFASIAEKYGKTPAQVILRWHLDNGFIVIPKSVTPSRIAENFDVFDFKLDKADRQQIDALDDPNGRIGPDPATATF